MTVDRTGRPRAARVLFALAAALLTLLSACGGDSVPPPGTPVVTFSSTNTRFASYVVAIDSITLTGADGTYATPLYSTETVDLTRISDFSELVEAPAVPSGSYTSATITLDYTLAKIWVRQTGGSTFLSPVLPNSDVGVYTATITVTFDPAHPLVITNGQSSRMAVNFDLDAFNTIDLDALTVTVNPFVTISQPPLDATPLRSRGLFVYTQDSFFVMNTRPFFDLTSALGAVTVNTTATTYFNIEGVTYTGAAGLKAMAGLAISTPVAAYGTLSSLAGITPSFNATVVLAGTSLEAAGLYDHLRGIVAARSGDTLTLFGADFLYSTGGVNGVCDTFYTTLGDTYYLPKTTVNIGSATIVSRDGYDVSGLTPASISVGQEVDAGGLTSCDSNANVTMDATQSQVRLTNTRLWGVVNSVSANELSVDLIRLGTFDPTVFNFAGAATSGSTINPANYPVNLGSLETPAPAGTLLAIDGAVNPFGTAPPAFTASAVTSGAATQQELVVEWVNGGSPDPFITIRPTELVVNLHSTNLGALHAIYTGPETLDLTTIEAGSPSIVLASGNPAENVLAVGNNSLTTGVSTYQSMADFATALNSVFSSQKIFRFVAIGQYNSASNTFVATRMSVSLEN